MKFLKVSIVVLSVIFALSACFINQRKSFVIADSKSYEASLFRQNCAICHGPEGNGHLLDNGTKVPNLREGELKAVSESAIEDQITNGGNGMVSFRGQLTQREIKLMTEFVYHDLRGN